MEFADTGAHCSFTECSQQDFLPFRCDACQKEYCLLHRSYAAHSCSASGSKDVTSVACPVCQKTVRFVSNQDPNDAWALHYASDCTQRPTQGPVTQYCAVQKCHDKLGPSNRYSCPKCRTLVCLAHRLPEDHNCALGRREAQLKATQDRVTVKSKQASTGTRPATNSIACPLCSKTFSSQALLTHHINDIHAEHSIACPICQTMFDTAELVTAHIDRDHVTTTTSHQAKEEEDKSSSSCSLS